MINNISLVSYIIGWLKADEIDTILFGGWAEELLGVIKPRQHKDIDLLYFSDSFEKVDAFLQQNIAFVEIRAKRFPHKRAFSYNGVMIEIFLVQKRGNTYFTDFWGIYSLKWPAKFCKTWTFENRGIIKIIDPAFINFYKSRQSTIKSLRSRMTVETGLQPI